MELHSSTTRFALACNNSTKIIEPIQSRCALLRYSSLTDAQILKRLLHICAEEKVPWVEEGLEAIIFTAEGDMRQAVNNLQATYSGFKFINSENVFKVCDQPHPLVIQKIVKRCIQGKFSSAHKSIIGMCNQGYSAQDIISTLFRVVKSYEMIEYLKLEYLKEIGFVHMKTLNGLGTLLQLGGLVSRLCQLGKKASQTMGS